MEPPRCISCYQRLVPIGNDREHGANHDDWPGREFHKKCWKSLSQEEKQFYSDNKRVYICVDYEKKEEAKALGARWDADEKRWFAEDEHSYSSELSVFKRKEERDNTWFMNCLLMYFR